MQWLHYHCQCLKWINNTIINRFSIKKIKATGSSCCRMKVDKDFVGTVNRNPNFLGLRRSPLGRWCDISVDTESTNLMTKQMYIQFIIVMIIL